MKIKRSILIFCSLLAILNSPQFAYSFQWKNNTNKIKYDKKVKKAQKTKKQIKYEKKIKGEWSKIADKLKKQDINKLVSWEDALWNRSLAQEGLFPKGSAIYTSSGKLKEMGINAIIHAAPSSMGNGKIQLSNPEWVKMDYNSIALSIDNSVKLAINNKHQKLMIPMVGGGIFIGQLEEHQQNYPNSFQMDQKEEWSDENDLNIASSNSIDEDINQKQKTHYKIRHVKVDHTETYLQICKSIIWSADQANSTQIELYFIGYGKEQFETFKKALKELQEEKKLATHESKIRIVEGDLLKMAKKYSIDAIVNAANMEVRFGGGLSGTIGQATRRIILINYEAKAILKKLIRQNRSLFDL